MIKFSISEKNYSISLGIPSSFYTSICSLRIGGKPQKVDKRRVISLARVARELGSCIFLYFQAQLAAVNERRRNTQLST